MDYNDELGGFGEDENNEISVCFLENLRIFLQGGMRNSTGA